MFFIYLVII